MTRNARIQFVWLAAPLLVALASFGCSSGSSGGEDEATTSSNAIVDVTLTKVTRTDISQMLTITGSIAAPPNRDVKVSSLVAGRVTDLLVAEGDRVRAGEVVARIDPRSYEQQLRQAQAAADQAHASLANAKLSVTRNQDLFSRGIAARKDLEDAQTQEAVAAAADDQADAALAIAKQQVARAVVTSPIAGQVAKRFVSVGEQVDGTAAQPVVEIADVSAAEMQANVPAKNLAALHAGEALTFSMSDFPGRKFEGRVVAISPAVDPSSGAGIVRIRIANSDGTLKLGMFLTAQVAVETHADALVVAPAAIYLNDQGQPRVFRVTGETATAVPVKLGIETPNLDELLSGPAEGDSVILTGGYGLADNAKVNVKGAGQP
ncbi:MAG: efflux RND transporter periplasmic adaptor subunit [Candidatus Acidiferrales bacterium]